MIETLPGPLDLLANVYSSVSEMLLADGAGGHCHAAGEVASTLAVETIAAALYSAPAPAQHATESTFQPGGKASHQDGQFAALAVPCMQLQQAFFAAHTRIQEVGRSTRIYSPPVSPLWSRETSS